LLSEFTISLDIRLESSTDLTRLKDATRRTDTPQNPPEPERLRDDLYPPPQAGLNMNGAERSVSELVIQKVAEVTDRDPVDLPPLYHSVDPDAVDELVESLSNGTIQFTYANQEIVITSRGEIALTAR
jgi:hypothetical protein